MMVLLLRFLCLITKFVNVLSSLPLIWLGPSRTLRAMAMMADRPSPLSSQTITARSSLPMNDIPSTSPQNPPLWTTRPMVKKDISTATAYGWRAWKETQGWGIFNPKVFQSNLQAAMESPESLCLALLFQNKPVGGLVADREQNWYTGLSTERIIFIYIAPEYRFGMKPYQLLLDKFHVWSQSLRTICAGDTSIQTERLMRLLDYYPAETVYCRVK